MVSSVRSYTNANNTLQHDMLWQLEYLFEGKQQSVRKRIGVTGCGSPSGLVSFVDHSGRPNNEVHAWSVEGDRMFDGLARRTCAVVESRRDRIHEMKQLWDCATESPTHKRAK
jgi:hypothetical protein